MATYSVPPSTTAAEQRSKDFILYGDEPYVSNYGRNSTYSEDMLIPLPSMAITESYADMIPPNLSDDLQVQEPEMAKQYYYLPPSSEAPADAIAPYSCSESIYTNAFDSPDIPRTLGSPYMNEIITTAAPSVLIHPPTIPYMPRNLSQGNHSTPTMSPTTPSYYCSGSDAGSAAGSPYHPPPGADTRLSEYGFDQAYVDPVLIGGSPQSAGLPASPSWGPPQSPPLSTASNSGSPSLGRSNTTNSRPSPRYRPYPSRRPSNGSISSRRSQGGSPNMSSAEYGTEFQRGGVLMQQSESLSTVGGKDGKETLCPECKKCFRDLRAHQLTHQLERPEKCPIGTCEYSKKGFARKYDCQRHTLTHYKGTMVCGFCPGSGSALEKSFNRADVFKRHLMAVHNVEQTAPNGRQKKTNGRGKVSVPAEDFSNNFSSGKCSTCSVTFATAQQFYEHLDDCVLSKVCQEEPAARANERNLAQVSIEEVEALLSSPPKTNDSVGDREDEDGVGSAGDIEDDESKDESFAVGSSKKSSKTGARRNTSGHSKAVSLKRQGTGANR